MKKPAAKGSAKHPATPPARPFGVPPLTKAATAAKKKPAPSKHAAAFGAPTSFGAVQARAAAASKHSSAKKPEATVTAPAKKAGAPKKAAFSPHSLVACCSAAALADHLRLSGGSCTDDDMLALYFSVTTDPDGGAPLEGILARAAEHGLAGYYPEYRLAAPDPDAIQIRRVLLPEARHAMVWHDGEWLTWDAWYPQSAFSAAVTEQAWEVAWR